MLRCLFEPYGKWEIFTYIIAGMKVTDVFSLEHDSTPPILLKTCFYPENGTSALAAMTLFYFSFQPTTNPKFLLFFHSKIWPSSQLVAQLMCSAQLCGNKMPFRGPVDMSAEKGSCECILAAHLQFPKDELPRKSLILDSFYFSEKGGNVNGRQKCSFQLQSLQHTFLEITIFSSLQLNHYSYIGFLLNSCSSVMLILPLYALSTFPKRVLH